MAVNVEWLIDDIERRVEALENAVDSAESHQEHWVASCADRVESVKGACPRSDFPDTEADVTATRTKRLISVTKPPKPSIAKSGEGEVKKRMIDVTFFTPR